MVREVHRTFVSAHRIVRETYNHLESGFPSPMCSVGSEGLIGETEKTNRSTSDGSDPHISLFGEFETQTKCLDKHYNNTITPLQDN